MSPAVRNRRGPRHRESHESAGDLIADPITSRRYNISTWDHEEEDWYGEAEHLTLWALRREIRDLEACGFSSLSYLVTRES